VPLAAELVHPSDALLPTQGLFLRCPLSISGIC
jgi:hypothetical protein